MIKKRKQTYKKYSIHFACSHFVFWSQQFIPPDKIYRFQYKFKNYIDSFCLLLSTQIQTLVQRKTGTEISLYFSSLRLKIFLLYFSGYLG